MLSDWELWAVANRMVADHGEEAALAVALKVDEMIERSDLDGEKVWRAVLKRVEEFEAPAGQPN
jgi:hypothetical protein